METFITSERGNKEWSFFMERKPTEITVRLKTQRRRSTRQKEGRNFFWPTLDLNFNEAKRPYFPPHEKEPGTIPHRPTSAFSPHV